MQIILAIVASIIYYISLCIGIAIAAEKVNGVDMPKDSDFPARAAKNISFVTIPINIISVLVPNPIVILIILVCALPLVIFILFRTIVNSPDITVTGRRAFILFYFLSGFFTTLVSLPLSILAGVIISEIAKKVGGL